MFRFLKGNGSGKFVQRHPALPPRTAQGVFAQVDSHPDQPIPDMFVVLKRLTGSVEFDEHFLHHVLGIGYAAEIVQRDAEDRILIPPGQPVEF